MREPPYQGWKTHNILVWETNDPPLNPLTDEDARAFVAAEKAERALRRKKSRKKMSAGRKLAKRLQKKQNK